ncbi:MAG: hypothetical protein EA371_03165 [Gammaproteobacteria bacterium]|nr:MAG: hypothetical protein EA371_03165 [Gammaproteobacteria bacterium]
MLTVGDLQDQGLTELLARYRTRRIDVPAGAAIPGSYWGAPEAGLLGDALVLRADTPLHSALHELAHRVCMDDARRRQLDTDAGGSDEEECAVCYLQLLLADCLPGVGHARLLADMDAWGYSFREGSAAAWVAGDGREAREWLVRRGLIDTRGRPTWRLA